MESRELRRTILRRVAFAAGGFSALILAAAIACGADPVRPPAEGFKTLTPHASLSTNTKQRLEIEGMINRIIAGTSTLSGFEPQFDAYFTSYLFPNWTLTTEKNLNELPKARDTFMRKVETSAKNPQAHEHLLDVSFKELSKIAQDPEFHPAVRYNAITIVGLLNQVEPNRGSGVKQLPEPYNKALAVLIEELKKPGNNEAVRVGALLGIMRHLEWDPYRAPANRMQAKDRGEIVDVLTSIVQAKDPPAGRSSEGQLWLRRRALEGLGYTGTTGADKNLADMVDKIIADDSEPISLRCTAAEVMSRIEYKAPVVVQVSDAAKKLGYLALFACHTELLRLEGLKKKDEELAKSGGQTGLGGGGGMPGMPPGVSGGGVPPAAPGGAAVPGGGMMPPGMGMPGAGGRKGGKGSGAEGMPGMGGVGPLAKDPKAYRIDYSKRRLRAELYAIQLALGEKKRQSAKAEEEGPAHGLASYVKFAVEPAKPTPDQQVLESIITQVKDVIRVVETLDQDAETYEKDLRKKMKELEKNTRPLPVATAKGGPAKAGAEDEVPMPGAKPAAKPAAAAEEVPTEEVPMAPAAPKAPAPAGKAPATPPVDPGKAAAPPAAAPAKAAPAAPPAAK